MRSDIACISYFALFATACSIVQQFLDYAFWKDIMTEQFQNAKNNPNDAEVQYQKGAMGFKLVLSYLRKPPCVMAFVT